MDTSTACLLGSSLLIGSAAVATGLMGLALPPGRRLEAILALVVGAGVGVAALGTGAALDIGTAGGTDLSVAFLLSSLGGALAVALTLIALVRGDRRGP